MILILSDKYDLHADRVEAVLAKKECRFVRFDPSSLPGTSQITVRPSRSQRKSTVYLEDRALDLSEVTAVWNRRAKHPIVSEDLEKHDRDLAHNESLHALRSLWQLTQHCFWVNPYWVEQAAHNKPFQLQTAASLNLDIPRTIVTNRPTDALEFFKSCDGAVIYKSLSNHVRDLGSTGFGIYTSKVTREMIETHKDAIALAPCQFQEYIPKKVELRITVIGECMFAAEIDSQAHDVSRIDWRRDLLRSPLSYREVHLPEQFKANLQQLMQRLGIVFGCVDAIVTPDDQLVFLEVNPSGQWIWIEDETGIPLIENFTEMLIQRTPRYHVALSRQS